MMIMAVPPRAMAPSFSKYSSSLRPMEVGAKIIPVSYTHLGYRTFGESYVFWKESMPGNLGMTIVRYLYQQGFTYGNPVSYTHLDVYKRQVFLSELQAMEIDGEIKGALVEILTA